MQWSAAAVTAVALYALPWALIALLDRGWWSYLLLAADLAALIVVAIKVWSPVVVLGASILSLGGAVVFLLITAGGQTCGSSQLADTLEWVGGVALAIPIGAWGVRRGFWAYAAVLAGWAVAGAWFVLVAQLVHGGTGGCFE